MEDLNVLQIVLSFLGGFGLFIFGMDYMSEGLKKAAGNKMKNLLGVLTNNPFLGVLAGMGVTAIIQSSSATTVMVVGFVNAGMMSLKQAVGVIMGANIGTTVTAWIVALGDWAAFLKPATLAPLMIIIGVILFLFSKKQASKHIGQVIFGFGILFLGLDLMGDAVKPLSKLDSIKNLFVTLGHNPILGILIGALVTAIIQSSSASVGILQTLAMAGLVPWSTAIYIILGQNIGTTVTAILSSVGASKNAKRAAVIHLLFNVIGSVIFAILAVILFKYAVPNLGQTLITTTEISVAHTVFNILNTLMLFPFAGGLVYLAERLVQGKDENPQSTLQHLDERILSTPSFAVENATKEVVRMGEFAAQNVKLAVKALLDGDMSQVQEVLEREKAINQLQHGINHYLIKLTNLPLSEKEHGIVTALFHNVGDIERVGDHAENLIELAQSLVQEEVRFSPTATKELKEISSKALESFEVALKACEKNDRSIAEKVNPIEQSVDQMEEMLRNRHMKRLAEEKCSPVAGVIFIDVLSNLERISDHATNIANTVLDEKKLLLTSQPLQIQ
jgi:phosphate:Na+ symporter